MFRWYGILGMLMILFAELNFYFKLEPFASWYFPIIWFGFIFVVDAINYTIRHNSLIRNRTRQFFIILLISAAIWWIFEFFNYAIINWGYSGILPETWIIRKLYGTIAFSTVLPAVIETFELVKNIKLFSHIKLKKHHKITKRFLYIMIGIGVISLILPTIWPTYFFPLVWFAFFFLLDPINYLHKQPSIIQHLKDRNLKIPIALIVAGTIAGLFWEFWNYYAVTKWTYSIPFVGFFKIFEMPILGYLGYGPFAWELYAMYYFVRSLHHGRKKNLLHLSTI